MKEFNDGDTEKEQERWPNYWPSVRLGHLYEVAHRIRRIGATDVKVVPDLLTVSFLDSKISSRTRLEIEPWNDGGPGWYWWCHVDLPSGFSMGALPAGRRILYCPRPRQVVHAYLEETWFERRPLPRKRK